jgi:CubicO group peptidase (beta-lactamase class C family)
MKYLISLFTAALFTVTVFAQNNFIRDSLDNYIRRGMQYWQVPGLSLVIVKDGHVMVLRGYGVKDMKNREAVDENTLFFIASNSKLFTGTALANLEFEKKLNLNDQIIKYFPGFRLYEKTSTELVTIKDMLTHRIGTKTFQGDFTFWNSILNRSEIMQKMRYLKPVNGFRDAYGYCNSCFMTAGEVIPKVTGGIAWEDYITKTILQPLEMNSSVALSNGIENRVKNIATPYTTSFTNQLKTVPYDHWDNLGPAASIVSNVKDLSHWLLFQLDSGRYNGKQVLPWPVLQKTRDLNIITNSRKNGRYPMHFRGYGLGLNSADYNGKQIYWHTGGAAGMVSNVCFVPEENLGIAILTNNDNQNFFECLRYQIVDAYLGVPYTNRSNDLLDGFNAEMKKSVDEITLWKMKAESFSKSYDSLQFQIKKYTGNYQNELYGKITISVRDRYSLKIKFLQHENLEATVTPMAGGEWLLEYNNIEYGVFKTKFSFNGEKVKSIRIKVNDFVEYDAYEFDKIK